MCDTLCAIGPEGALFAKNSDRPSAEVQLIESLPARAPGGTLRTQYLELPDEGATAMLASRPAWLWGLEHGVNEHRVAIGEREPSGVSMIGRRIINDAVSPGVR